MDKIQTIFRAGLVVGVLLLAIGYVFTYSLFLWAGGIIGAVSLLVLAGLSLMTILKKEKKEPEKMNEGGVVK